MDIHVVCFEKALNTFGNQKNDVKMSKYLRSYFNICVISMSIPNVLHPEMQQNLQFHLCKSEFWLCGLNKSQSVGAEMTVQTFQPALHEDQMLNSHLA